MCIVAANACLAFPFQRIPAAYEQLQDEKTLARIFLVTHQTTFNLNCWLELSRLQLRVGGLAVVTFLLTITATWAVLGANWSDFITIQPTLPF